MFAARASSTMGRYAARRGVGAVPSSSSSSAAAAAGRGATKSGGARRTMGGGGHWMSVSQPHTYAGEACGFLTWLWVFYRAKHDLPVVLGLRHPWEHAEDPWAIVDHVENLHALEEDWEDFAIRSTNPGEDDDDADEEGGEDNEDGDDGDDDDDE